MPEPCRCRRRLAWCVLRFGRWLHGDDVLLVKHRGATPADLLVWAQAAVEEFEYLDAEGFRLDA